ncbi:MAG: hypothetical protein J6U14_00015 [Bacteroidaceae bacterium]|nr:hypothetical protein [Bacteroidaceae bacterium]
MKKVLLFLLAVALYGCGDEEQIANTRNEAEPIELNGEQMEINSSLQSFSWEFFSQVYRGKGDGNNIIVSPISLEMNLGMLLIGLTGNSKQELLKVMHLQGHDTNDIDLFFKRMMEGIQRTDKQTTFNSANSFWFDEKYRVAKDFSSVIKNNYGAEVGSVDFADIKAKDTINKWCAQQTNQRILQIVNDTNPDMLFYLINAIYFDSTWEKPFEKGDYEIFTYENGTQDKIRMMEKKGNWLFSERDSYMICSMPYTNGSFSMLLILPKVGYDVKDVMANLEVEDLLLSRMYNTDVHVWMPEFQCVYPINDIYAKLMDMNPNFVLNANEMDMFDEAIKGDVYIAQKNYIKVDERGTEAATVTYTGMEATAPPAFERKYVEMHFDHPFLYSIIETSTNCPLFIGYHGN